MAKKKVTVSVDQLRELAAALADISGGLKALSLESALRARTRLDELVADLNKTADGLEASAAAPEAPEAPAPEGEKGSE